MIATQKELYLIKNLAEAGIRSWLRSVGEYFTPPIEETSADWHFQGLTKARFCEIMDYATKLAFPGNTISEYELIKYQAEQAMFKAMKGE